MSEYERCLDCKIVILKEVEDVTGRFEVEDGVLCKACFAKRLGNEIEKHPLKRMGEAQETQKP